MAIETVTAFLFTAALGSWALKGMTSVAKDVKELLGDKHTPYRAFDVGVLEKTGGLAGELPEVTAGTIATLRPLLSALATNDYVVVDSLGPREKEWLELALHTCPGAIVAIWQIGDKTAIHVVGGKS